MIDESLLNTAFVPDLVAKLDDFGKLTGQNPLHDLTTKSILITSDDAKSTLMGTTNQLRVNIELYLQKKDPTPATPTAGGTPALSATATDGTGHSATATITGGTPGATTTPTGPGATKTGGTSSSSSTGGTIPLPPPATAPAGGTSGGGGTSASAVSSSIRVGTMLPPPGDLPTPVRHDPVVARAALAPAVVRPAPAQPLPGVECADDPFVVVGARLRTPRGASGAVPAAPPRGPASTAPPQTRPNRLPAIRDSFLNQLPR